MITFYIGLCIEYPYRIEMYSNAKSREPHQVHPEQFLLRVLFVSSGFVWRPPLNPFTPQFIQ
jgi:hypothetical protein